MKTEWPGRLRESAARATITGWNAVIEYREYRPCAELAPYVKCFWQLESTVDIGDSAPERILPDGCAEIMVHYGDRFRRAHRNGLLETQPRSFIFGQLSRHIEVGPTGRAGIIAVRFHPGGAYPFIPIPLSELTNTSIDLTTLWGAVGRELEECLLNAESTESRLALLRTFLIRKLRAESGRDRLVAECVRRIVTSRGRLGIDAVTSDLDISHRQIERKFASVVGMSPKLLSRITRFQNVFRLVNEGRVNSLTALSYEGGYYDQAHFIRDFKAFAGVNPRAYFAASNQLSEHFTEKGEEDARNLPIDSL